MQQFNQQYVNNYFKPFLLEVLKDMNTPTKELGRGQYLKNLLRGVALTEHEKNSFDTEYFEASTTVLTLDKELRRKFIEELGNLIKSRIRLSDEQGMKDAFLPGEANKYGINATYTKNIDRLAHQLIIKFEEYLLGPEKEGSRALIGKDGEIIVTKESDLSDDEVIPFMEPGLSETIYTSRGPTAGSSGNKKFKGTTIKEDSVKVEQSKIEQLLEESGLEIVDEIKIRNGIAEGTVKDTEGQELSVRIETTKPDNDPDKFVFTFKSYGPGKNLAGKEIKSTQKDIRTTFFDGEDRKTAKKTYEYQDKNKEQELPGKLIEAPQVEKYKPAMVRETPPAGKEVAKIGNMKGETIAKGIAELTVPIAPPVVEGKGARVKTKVELKAPIVPKLKKGKTNKEASIIEKITVYKAKRQKMET